MLFDPKWKPAETEIKLEDWQKLLLEAADLIEKRGWCQHRLRDWRGRMCALGALSKAARYNNLPDSFGVANTALNKASDALEEAIGTTVPYWNDSAYRTKQSVIETMREVATRKGGRVV